MTTHCETVGIVPNAAWYLDHLPLHRQERIDARAGVWVGRQARCRYVESVAHLLITIHQQLKSRILSSNYIHVDETFTKLLDPDRRGRSQDAYLWGYYAPHEEAFVLEFSPSRSGTILYDFFPKNKQTVPRCTPVSSNTDAGSRTWSV